MKQAKSSSKKNLLFLSSNRSYLNELSSELCLDEFTIFLVVNNRELNALLEKIEPDIVLIDLAAQPIEEINIVTYIKSRSPGARVVTLAEIEQIEEARASLQQGAAFYLMKPISCDDIKVVVSKLSFGLDRATEYREFEQQVLSDLMSGSPAMEKVLKLAMKIAPTASNVLLTGGSGTGKEFFAKIIHRLSKRDEGKFVTVNCGAIPETLFESEMFGHKKGAFTGADNDKSGLVEEAHMGTLFLDEVGELSLSSQVKLLRFIQERTFTRVGDPAQRRVNVRVIAATNRNLAQMVIDGTFREDLFFRLNVFILNLPPLRDRKETIPGLIRLFVHRKNVELEKNVNSFTKGAEAILANYDYPGNVRELENIIEHAMVLSEGAEIKEADLPETMFGKQLMLSGPMDVVRYTGRKIKTMEELEKEHIMLALSVYNHNYTESAKALGISRSTLWRKMKSFSIPKEK